MARISITNVKEDVKRGLKAATAVSGVEMSSVIRERLPRIIAEIEGARPAVEDLEAATVALMQAIALYQRRQYNDAEQRVRAILDQHPWLGNPHDA